MRHYALPVKPQKPRATKRWRKVNAEYGRLVSRSALRGLSAEEWRRFDGLARWLNARWSCWYHPIIRRMERAERKGKQLVRLLSG